MATADLLERRSVIFDIREIQSQKTQITNAGCVSETSFIAETDDDLSYRTALKSFSKMVRAGTENIVSNDAFTCKSSITLDVSQIQSANQANYNDEMLVPQHQMISDDELEACGYMGWL